MPAPLRSVMIPAVDLALLLRRACASDDTCNRALTTIVRVCRYTAPAPEHVAAVKHLYTEMCGGTLSTDHAARIILTLAEL